MVRVEGGERVDIGDFEALIRQSFSGDASVIGTIVANAALLDGFDATVAAATTLRITRNAGAFIAPFLVPANHLYNSGAIVSSVLNDDAGAVSIDLALGPLVNDWYHVYVTLSLVNADNLERVFWNPTTSVEYKQNIDTRWVLTWALDTALAAGAAPPNSVRVATINWDGTLTAAKIYATKQMMFEGNGVPGGTGATVPAPVSFDHSLLADFSRSDDRSANGAGDLTTFANAVLKCIEEVKDPVNGKWWAKPDNQTSLQSVRTHHFSVGYPARPGNFNATVTAGPNARWDITTALASLSTVAAALGGPVTVVLRPGEYYVSAAVVFNSAIRITGMGQEQVTVEFSLAGIWQFYGDVTAVIEEMSTVAEDASTAIITIAQNVDFVARNISHTWTAGSTPKQWVLVVAGAPADGSIRVEDSSIYGQIRSATQLYNVFIVRSFVETIDLTDLLNFHADGMTCDTIELDGVVNTTTVIDSTIGHLDMSGAAGGDVLFQRIVLVRPPHGALAAETYRMLINLTGASGATRARFVLEDIDCYSNPASTVMNGISLGSTPDTFEYCRLSRLRFFPGHVDDLNGWGAGWAVTAVAGLARHVAEDITIHDFAQNGVAWPGVLRRVTLRKDRSGSWAGVMLQDCERIENLTIDVSYNPAAPPAASPTAIVRNCAVVDSARIYVPECRGGAYALNFTAAALSGAKGLLRDVVIGIDGVANPGIEIDASNLGSFRVERSRFYSTITKLTIAHTTAAGDPSLELRNVWCENDLTLLTYLLQDQTVNGARLILDSVEVGGEGLFQGLWRTLTATDCGFNEGLRVTRTAKNLTGSSAMFTRCRFFEQGGSGGGSGYAWKPCNPTNTMKAAIQVYGLNGDSEHDFEDVILENCEVRAALDAAFYSVGNQEGAVWLEAASRVEINNCRLHFELRSAISSYKAIRLLGRTMRVSGSDVRVWALGTGYDINDIVTMLENGPATQDMTAASLSAFEVVDCRISTSKEGAFNQALVDESVLLVGTNLATHTGARMIRFSDNSVSFGAKQAATKLVKDVSAAQFLDNTGYDGGVASGNAIYERNLGSWSTTIANHLVVTRGDASAVTFATGANQLASKV